MQYCPHQLASSAHKSLQGQLGSVNTRPLVLQTVQGYQLPLVAQLVQSIVPPQMQFPLNQQMVISSEVEYMLEKQAITAVQLSKGNFIPQISVVSKKDGGYAQ